MSILYLGRNEVVVDVPALAQVGEEMYLQGGRIAKGSIGKVVQILGQSGGMTKIRVQLVKGKILPKKPGTSGPEKGVDPAQEYFDHPGMETASQRFRKRRPTQQEGGTPWWGDRDPRPRRGPGSLVVQTPYQFNPPPQAYHPEYEERWSGGSRVEVHPAGGVAAVIADPSLQPRGTRSEYVPPEEFARGMGYNIDYGDFSPDGGNYHGSRAREYREQWAASEHDPYGPLQRKDGNVAQPIRDTMPQRALQSPHAVDPFDPSRKPNYNVHQQYQRDQLEALRRGGQR